MGRVAGFADVETEFRRRTDRMVWCSMVTTDRRGRLRARLIHPHWEGPVGWLLTGRQSLKARHLAVNPYTSLTYWDQANEQVHAECRTEWEERPDEKRRVWDLFKHAPPPLGYDPGLFFPSVDDPSFGALRLLPWRIELWSLADMVSGRSATVWKA